MQGSFFLTDTWVRKLDVMVMPKISGIAPPSPTHSVPGASRPTRLKSGKKEQPGTQSSQSSPTVRLPSPSPPTSIEPSESFSRLDQMGQQLTTSMATVIQLQPDVQKLKDKFSRGMLLKQKGELGKQRHVGELLLLVQFAHLVIP